MTCGRERPSGLDERGVPEGRPADALDGVRNIRVHLPCLGFVWRLRGRAFLRCRLLRCWLLRHCLLRGALHCRFLLRHAPESTLTLSARSIAGWPGGGEAGACILRRNPARVLEEPAGKIVGDARVERAVRALEEVTNPCHRGPVCTSSARGRNIPG